MFDILKEILNNTNDIELASIVGCILDHKELINHFAACTLTHRWNGVLGKLYIMVSNDFVWSIDLEHRWISIPNTSIREAFAISKK